ncbi:uncharacterized protein LOC114530206 [Dendronephthya gigantea]|uniref:uncharacterized protein LOC114530206 n=1 Tax=Dendronephthya gigantea TaxID=151771 RepID=UPI00106C63E7|nr:uncharacterized protein LOC114530206 [Dendronephthya gigantea]
MAAHRQGRSDVDHISRAEEAASRPENTLAYVEGEAEGECAGQVESPNHSKDENQSSVLDAIRHLSAEMAAMKQDMSRLQTSTKKRKRRDSSADESVLDTSDKEQTGKAVNAELAAIVESLLGEKLPDAKLQAKVDLYPRPDNINGLKTPRVNQLIWQQLATSVRTYDSKQKTQTVLLACVAAMLRAADLALEKNLDKTIITTITDAAALAIQCHHDLNALRRFHMKKELHDDYAALCNASTPASDELFGDLTKLTKDIQEANKVAKKVKRDRPSSSYPSTNQKYATKRRYNPYNKTRSDRDFRWGRGKQKDRRKQHTNSQKQN